MNEKEPSAYTHWEAPTAPPAAPAATDEQLNTVRELAYVEGYTAGHRAGEADVARLRELAAGFARELDSLDSALAETLRDLALDVARQVIGAELAVHPERVLDVVSQALHQVSESSRESRLVLHPADAMLVRERLGPALAHARLRLVEDARMVRGGCRIESVFGDIDAALPTRWRQIVQALGGNPGWSES